MNSEGGMMGPWGVHGWGGGGGGTGFGGSVSMCVCTCVYEEKKDDQSQIVSIPHTCHETFKGENFRLFAKVFSVKFWGVTFLLVPVSNPRKFSLTFHYFTKVFSLKSYQLYGM